MHSARPSVAWLSLLDSFDPAFEGVDPREGRTCSRSKETGWIVAHCIPAAFISLSIFIDHRFVILHIPTSAFNRPAVGPPVHPKSVVLRLLYSILAPFASVTVYFKPSHAEMSGSFLKKRAGETNSGLPPSVLPSVHPGLLTLPDHTSLHPGSLAIGDA